MADMEAQDVLLADCRASVLADMRRETLVLMLLKKRCRHFWRPRVFSASQLEGDGWLDLELASVDVGQERYKTTGFSMDTRSRHCTARVRGDAPGRADGPGGGPCLVGPVRNRAALSWWGTVPQLVR